MKLIVQKFGGTSVQDWEAMRRVMDIVRERGISKTTRPLVVLSACAGVTNQLIRISELALRESTTEANSEISRLVARHEEIAIRLIHTPQSKKTVLGILNEIGAELRTLVRGVHLLRELSSRSKDQFQSIGERCSTLIFAHAFAEALATPASGTKNAKRKTTSRVAPKIHLFDAREFFITSSDHTAARPLLPQISRKMKRVRTALANGEVGVTQGFIGSTAEGITTTIGRGGSDFSAAIMGVALEASEIQIWTDVAGIMTSDPRSVPGAKTIGSISFEDASALAFFGAKVLHPETIWPAVEKGIPVRVLSSKEPEKEGTVILKNTDSEDEQTLSGIAVKKNIVLARCSSSNGLPELNIQQAFVESLDRLSLIPYAISVSADSATYVLDEGPALGELRGLIEGQANLEYSREKALITVVGSALENSAGLGAQLFSALGEINCELVSYGGSNSSISLAVANKLADEAARRIHKAFFERS